MLRRWGCVIVLALCALGAAAASAAAAEGEPSPLKPQLVLSGVQNLAPTAAESAAGPLPATGEPLEPWAAAAAKRIVAAYQRRGYSYARAWYRVAPEGVVRIHIDEGQMRIVFTGVGGITAFFYQVDFNLPHNVFYRPALQRALEELRHKHDLLNAYYRVKETAEAYLTPLGQAGAQRVLQVYIVQREYVGWGFNIGLSSTWGVLPGISYSQGGLLWRDDQLRAKLEIAFPFRRYLFDEDPKFTWVHGAMSCAYRFPRWFNHKLGLRPDTSLQASRYERADLGAEGFYLLHNATVANLVGYLPPVELGFGMGLDVASIFGVEQVPEQTTPPLVEPTLALRALSRFSFALQPSSEVLRRDQRSFLTANLELRSAKFADWMLDLRLEGQVFGIRGRHRLIGRGRALVLAGAVRFWDEVQLAGSYQRVFFGSRYWVWQTFQLETAYRVNLFWDWFEIGIFHDLSAFADRSAGAHDWAIANAFGPSLHFLLFDLFALGIYSGFGFAPVGFDHTFSFNLETVF